MGYITPDSELLSGVTFASEQHAQVLIDAASSAIDRYLNRYIEQAQRDMELPNRNGAEIFLPAYPVDHVLRVCTDQMDALNITATGEVATYSVGETGLKLYRVSNGVAATTTLLYATYPTLIDLAEAMPTGFGSTVAIGYETFPSADLVRGQTGSCKPVQQLALWIDAGGSAYRVDQKRGFISLRGYCPQFVRVIWTGGFATVPADLQKVCADLVANAADPKNGAITSESLGEYSYTISTDLDALPVTSRRVLDSYRNRGV